MKIKKNPYLLWGKRILVYILGLYLTAMGVVFSARSALGVSPVSSLGNVLFQIGRDAGAPAVVNLGNCTTAVFCVYLVVELLILRRDFKAEMLLQILVSLLFGQLVNLATAMLSSLPMPVALMVPSSTVQDSVPRVSPLKSRQPARVSPSKRSCHPSAVSARVRVLSLGAQPVSIAAAAARKNSVFFMVSCSVVNQEQR